MKKFLALYLPQYHEVEENNIWWGKGYTEWSAVKEAKSLFKGHCQPIEPLNDYYYDLSDSTGSVWKWQANLAKQYGIHGFCIYHYWFDSSHQLLEKPMEILLNHPEIDINYCICWANETWTRTWYGKESELLMEQKYGDRTEWEIHFQYLLPFFSDRRYIKINNKPMINIYRTMEIDALDEMILVWNKLAKEAGFDGVYIVSGNTNGLLDDRDNIIDAYYNFEPTYTLKHKLPFLEKKKYEAKVLINTIYNKIFKAEILERIVDINDIYKYMQKNPSYTNKPVYYGIVPKWDNTPRRGNKGMVYLNSSPSVFEKMLQETVDKCESEYIYINAWNEWGEGAILEPDKIDKYGYLEAIKNVVDREEGTK